MVDTLQVQLSELTNKRQSRILYKPGYEGGDSTLSTLKHRNIDYITFSSTVLILSFFILFYL